jgi:hypothetical protein
MPQVPLRPLYSSGFDSRDADKALIRALRPLRENLSLLCSQVRSQVEANPRHCLEIVRAFDASKSPLLKTLNCLVGANDASRDAAHDEVAATIRSCLIDYVNETRDWSTALPLFENCLALVQAATLRSTIEEDIVILQGNLAAQRAERAHAPQSTSSSNSKTAAHGQYPPESGARPASGIAQRVGFSIGRTWREMPPLGRALFVVLVLGLLVVLKVMSNGSDATSAPSPTTTDNFPNVSPSITPGSESVPESTPSTSVSNEQSDSPSPSTPITSTPASSDNAELDTLKQDIEASQSRLAGMEAELQSINSNLDEYKATIDSDKATLTQMESDSSSGLQVDQDEYERIRRRHNQNVDKFNEEVERHNELLRAYRTLLASTNEKIDKYNSMVKSQ